MKELTFFILFTIPYFSFSQEKMIEIIKEERGQIIVLSALNKDSQYSYEVTLNVESQGYKLTKSVPHTEKVRAGETVEMIQIIAKPEEKRSLKYSFSSKRLGSQSEITHRLEREETRVDERNEMETGVFMFTNFDCNACDTARKYLMENGIDFKEINIQKNQSNDLLLWRRLERMGYKGKNVAMPVMMVDGKLYPENQDLKGFLEGLKK